MKLSFHENHRLLFGAALAGFMALTVVIAVAPASWVQEHTEPLPGSRALTAGETRGLAIYVAEGCLYCHTQQVRPLPVDKPFGRPSAPGDYARLRPQDPWRMTPALLGTERTGPDLSNMAARQPSDMWNFIHLFNPRAVVKDSVMQAYPWLFAVKATLSPGEVAVPVPPGFAKQGGKVVTTQAARDLVSYLLALKQVPIAGGALSREAAGASGESETQGATIYATHCASCHGPDGMGVAGAFPPMKNDPVVVDADPARHIQIVLFGLENAAINGVSYQAKMPPHKDVLSDEEIAAVVNHERTSWGNNAKTVTAGDVAQARKKGGA